MNSFAARMLSNRIIQYIIIVMLALLAAISVYQGSRNAVNYSQDFQWDAAKALEMRIDPYELSFTPGEDITNPSLSAFYRLFTDKGDKQAMEANQFPSLLCLLFPYTFLEPLAARYAWLISNLIFTLGIIILLRKTFLRDLSLFEAGVIILLMLAGTPYRNQLGVGQHTLFSFFFFLLAVKCDESKDLKGSIGVTLSLFICYFKYTLTAPLTLYLLYKRRIKEFVVSVLMHIALTIFSAAWLGKSVIYMITAPLRVASVLSSEGGLDLGALMGGGRAPLVVGGIIALLLVVIACFWPENQDELLFTLLLLWSLILTYHRTYDFFVLSAASTIVLGGKKLLIPDKINGIIRIYYLVLVMAVYFGLRVFNENLTSRIAVGLMYYVFTIVISAIAVFTIKNGKNGKNTGAK